MYKLCFDQFRVAKWPSFGIELPTQLTICTPCLSLFVNLIISRLGFGVKFGFLLQSFQVIFFTFYFLLKSITKDLRDIKKIKK